MLLGDIRARPRRPPGRAAPRPAARAGARSPLQGGGRRSSQPPASSRNHLRPVLTRVIAVARSWSICARGEPPADGCPNVLRGCEGKSGSGLLRRVPLVPRHHAGVGTAAERWSWEAPCFPAANSRALAQPCLHTTLAGPFRKPRLGFLDGRSRARTPAASGQQRAGAELVLREE